jgi:hypothetical protein
MRIFKKWINVNLGLRCNSSYVVGTCSVGENPNFGWKKLKGRNYLEIPVFGGKVRLKLILKE